MQPRLIAGRYQVLRAIGSGGMGTVWLCRDEVLGREVAVKQIGALPGESATETKRAMREARSAAALNHPNAVAVYDVVTQDERPWLVMEYVEGQTLADEISRAGRLSPQRVADIGAQLAGALARAHERRIVHRDIKPGNVLIDKAGRPKISDFGIARRHGDDQLTQTGFVTGTPGYLSPELARGGDPDSASDVWALGATLYAAVEGQSPYEPRSNPIAMLMAIATGRPRPMTNAGSLRPAIEAMMHEDPARRWDMATSAQRLGRIASGVATAVMPILEPGDPPDTRVIASPPVESTQRLDSTQRFDSTQGLDSTQRLDAAAPGAAAAVRVPPPGDRRSGRRWLPLVFVALLVAALGVPYLLSQLGDQGGTDPVLATATRTAPAKTTANGSSKTSAQPSATTVPSTTAAPDPGADKRLENFVKSYYFDVTHNTDRTWAQLAPKMQSAAGGRGGYDAFWKTIDNVKVNQTQPDAADNSAVVNLTFTRRDGTRSTENHQFTFVNNGGDYLIENDRLGR
jgi:serine/threonine protein kinase